MKRNPRSPRNPRNPKDREQKNKFNNCGKQSPAKIWTLEDVAQVKYVKRNKPVRYYNSPFAFGMNIIDSLTE